MNNQEISGALSEIHQISGSLSVGGGVGDYGDLTGKPTLNGVTIEGNKTSADYGITGTVFADPNNDGNIVISFAG